VNPPAVLIVLPIEGAPRVIADCMTEGEEQRLTLWLTEARPEYGDLAARALELAEEAKAA
jgi:hypothetical protein